MDRLAESSTTATVQSVPSRMPSVHAQSLSDISSLRKTRFVRHALKLDPNVDTFVAITIRNLMYLIIRAFQYQMG